MGAFYKARIGEFLAVEPATLMLELTSGAAGMGFDLRADQHAAWVEQIEVLAGSLRTIAARDPEAASWGILLEYQIPGRPKRLDAVLLDDCGIIAIEFKIGASEFLSGSKWQLREYCWNLRDFHRESESAPIAPILVATAAPTVPPIFPSGYEDKHKLILPMQLANRETLADALTQAHARLTEIGRHPLDLSLWNSSQAHTTQTVIEEARSLFQAHDVREISHAHADNTTDALDALVNVVRESRKRGLRSICFLTGVPGADKTLVGLHAAYSLPMAEAAGGPISFASGNQPLLDVLHAALTINRATKARAQREIGHDLSAPVQNVHEFALRNLLDPQQRPPSEHVVVFDEAQRVWTADKVEQGIGKRVQRRRLTQEQAAGVLAYEHSEPELLLRVMERCPGWCVIVALIGGGQEIYDGEAGLTAWGRAIENARGAWTVWVAPEAMEGDASVAGQTLFPKGRPEKVALNPTQKLHLSVAKRCQRAERYADWVNHVLDARPDQAAALMSALEEFPMLLTRDFVQAKRLLREYAGDESRCGLVASSGGMRLRADGVELNREFRSSLKYPDWFLPPLGDIRSSNQLEVAATEFECQGLELDWTCVCWGGDFVPVAGEQRWLLRYLYNGGNSGPHWRNVRNPVEQEFIRNRYRVLLTRARFGTVIYIPCGSPTDQTRNPAELDAIADYLVSCGLSLS